ncbi:MAG: type IV toxin-antitoxin system AbiEi family antitoxin [Verrucomicrobia bacterium]|nr:type IV toxin-antitoxin system AbiEi family antitoxin [Verrucomicrobiota bacterium]
MEVYLSINDWIENLASKGRHSFSLNEVRYAFANDTEAAIKLKLTRLVEKKKIISIHKGYYLIITSQYASRGVLPPALFIDGLMKFLERPYYVGLLNAALFHGAAHQQPQEYFVVTNFPALRPTIKKGIKINYISKKEVPELYLEKRKTETGSIAISNPALTAIDLVQFDKRVGGLDRAATVLNELAEAIKPEQITKRFLREVPVAAIQRLGFLLEVILKKDIGKHLYKVSQKERLDFFRIPLKTSAVKKGYLSDERWKVIVNTEIEIDE